MPVCTDLKWPRPAGPGSKVSVRGRDESQAEAWECCILATRAAGTSGQWQGPGAPGCEEMNSRKDRKQWNKGSVKQGGRVCVGRPTERLSESPALVAVWHLNGALPPGFLPPASCFSWPWAHVCWIWVQACAQHLSHKMDSSEGGLRGSRHLLLWGDTPSLLTSETEPFCMSLVGKVSHFKKENDAISICYLGRVTSSLGPCLHCGETSPPDWGAPAPASAVSASWSRPLLQAPC